MTTYNSQEHRHEDGNKKLLLTIDGKQYEWDKEYISGTEIKYLAGIPPDVDIHLSIKEPWEDELIPNEEKVNLARPEIEHFYCKKKLELTINGKLYNWYKQYITGLEIKKLAGIEEPAELFLAITRLWEDEQVSDEKTIDLARPGIEHFYTKRHCEENLVTIFIDRKEIKTTRGKYTVSEIKKLGQVPISYDLEEVINGVLTPLDDNGHVLIKGCEVFISHVKDGTSA